MTLPASHTALPNGLCFFERGWLSSNSLLVQNRDHAVVFDTGYLTHANQLLELLSYRLQGQALDLIVNSHLHSDHCGGNALLQATFPSIDIQISTKQFEHVHNWDHTALTYEFTGQNCAPFKPTLHLHDGDLIHTGDYCWQAFAAPGHDNDEFIFFEPDQKILLSADALWENGLGVVFPEFLGGIGFENVSKTLDLIESLKPQLVLPGHGSVFTNISQPISHARKKLDYFSKSKEAHALYSAKVLLKFKLLEIQKIPFSEFIKWAVNIHMLELIHSHFFYSIAKKSWLESLIHELASRGAASVDTEFICNQ